MAISEPANTKQFQCLVDYGLSVQVDGVLLRAFHCRHNSAFPAPQHVSYLQILLGLLNLGEVLQMQPS